jgi:uncharacterized protein involved in response to NO
MNSPSARWRILTAAPHRMFFASGVAWLLAWSGWWLLILALRAAGVAGYEPVLPGLLLHGGIILFVVLPPFIYGFLLTVFPRWMPAPPPAQGAMLAACGALNAGNLLMLAGSALAPGLFASGWLLATLALAIIATTLLGILVRARGSVSHAYAVLMGLAAGLLGMVLFARMAATGDFSSWPLARGLGLWGFLLVVYFSVCHRMIPFFSSRVVPGYVAWRPDWVLYLFVLLAIARGTLELAPGAAWLASIPLAAIGVWCVARWWPRQRTGVRLLAVLHLSLAWLAMGLVLAAVGDLGAALGYNGVIGRAPLHVLGMGFMGGMLMAMVTRVTLGHSGQPLVLDGVTWKLFLVVQGATLLRVGAEFAPGGANMLSLAAALAWVGAFGAWALWHAPSYFRPREDGAPG